MLVGYKDISSGYTDFNWIQIIKTNQPRRVGSITPDGEYIYNDITDNEPYYNSTNNEQSDYTINRGYTTGFEDAPNREINNGFVHWSAILSLMGGNKYPDNRMFNLHYGFSMDSAGNVNIITPSAVSNQFQFRR